MLRWCLRWLLGWLGGVALGWSAAAAPAVANTPVLPAPLQQHALPMWLIDPDSGLIISANAAAQRFYGYPELAQGTLNIQRINQLNADEIRAEMARAREQGRQFFVFPHRLASGDVVTVEVHSSPVEIDGRRLLLSVLLPESRSASLQAELQRYQNRLESLVAQRTAAAVHAERARTTIAMGAGAALALATVVLGIISLQLRRLARQRQQLATELEDTLRGARLARIRWDVSAGTVTLCARALAWLGHSQHAGQPIPLSVWTDWLHPDDRERLQQLLREYLRRQLPDADVRLRLRHADGSWKWVEIWARVTARDPVSGRALTVSGLARDVTEAVALEEARTIAASVFEDAGEAIVVLDERGVVQQVNAAMERLSGYDRQALIGAANLPWRVDAGSGVRGWRRLLQQLRREGRWHGESTWRRADGSELPVIETITVVRDANNRILRYLIIAQDISELKAQQQALLHQAHYDLLTGLPNRNLLADRLELALAMARRHHRQVVVAYLDLDDFKSINERWGHEHADRLLRQLAEALRASLREGDTLARLGGDEFVAVLVDLDASDDWTSIVNRLLQTCVDAGQRLGLTLGASAGVTVFPHDDADAEVLLRHADQALYRAKRDGRGRWVAYDPREDQAAAAHAELVAEVRRALAQQEFTLFLQPRVRLTDGKVEGAEALLRWQHPSRGLLAPGAFLPMIEDDAVMVDVGQWVLERALDILEQWRDGPCSGALLSINVAARQLRDPAFTERLERTLANHPRVDPRCLELEITESGALDGIDQLERILQRCDQLGVRIAIDDFGTGYSSLSYLKRLPAHVVKIDQSFVRDVFEDPDDLRIIDGIIALGRAFGLHIVAEGVETLEQATLLLRLGAATAQGYGIARPMPVSEWPEWVRRWAAPAQWHTWARLLGSPWINLMARIEVEHRAAFLHLQARTAPLPPAHDCAVQRMLLEALPASAQDWPEYAAFVAAHQRLHDAAERWWQSSDPADADSDAQLQAAQQQLIEALQQLALRLAGANGHEPAPPSVSAVEAVH